MKKNCFLFSLLFMCSGLVAQNTFPSSGFVGIGTTSPISDMHVKSALQYPRYFVQSTHASGKPGYTIADVSGSEIWSMQYDSPGQFLGFYKGVSGFGNKMVITNSGNVGIGTTSPGSFKLAVEGKIGAREIQVTNTTPWPDYVFEKDYKVMSLDELIEFISINKHLPSVPSASEITSAHGVNLGEMTSKLLEKIEELTLYIIELKAENDAIKAKVELILNNNSK